MLTMLNKGGYWKTRQTFVEYRVEPIMFIQMNIQKAYSKVWEISTFVEKLTAQLENFRKFSLFLNESPFHIVEFSSLLYLELIP